MLSQAVDGRGKRRGGAMQDVGSVLRDGCRGNGEAEAGHGEIGRHLTREGALLRARGTLLLGGGS